MQRGTTTKLTMRPEFPVSVASTLYGANMNCVAFNLDFINNVDPSLAKEIVKIFEICKRLGANHGKNSN